MEKKLKMTFEANNCKHILAFLWDTEPDPNDLTYNDLIRLAQGMFKDQHIRLDRETCPLLDKFRSTLSPEEKTEYDQANPMVQEVSMLNFRRRIRMALYNKMASLTLEDLNKMEEEV